jgi:hypothetical protein
MVNAFVLIGPWPLTRLACIFYYPNLLFAEALSDCDPVQAGKKGKRKDI